MEFAKNVPKPKVAPKPAPVRPGGDEESRLSDYDDMLGRGGSGLAHRGGATMSTVEELEARHLQYRQQVEMIRKEFGAH
jgi:Jhy protein